MKSPQRVVWSEGLFMCPQHLQQQDLYHERLLDARVQAVVPHSWGVVEMEIDAQALGAGQVRLARFVGVLPDGLSVGFEHGDDEAPAPRPVEGHFPPAQRELEVFLGIPREREGLVNYGDGAGGAPVARFSVARRNIADTTATAAEISVGFARRNLQILFGDEVREDYETIKVAELVRDKLGALTVNDAYIAPCLRIAASPFIVAGLKRMLVMMIAKQRDLADQRRHRDASSVEFSGSDITRYLQLSALNMSIPVLTHLAETADLSPRDTYLYLVQVAGQLSTFAVDADPSKLPSFQYTNLRQTYEELFARITGLLHATVQQQFLPVTLEVKQGINIGRFENERVVQCQQFVLGVKSEIPEAQVAEHLPKLSKIAALSQIEQILRSATPGVSLRVTHRPPPEIPVRAGMVYFLLSTQDAYWQSVQRERTIAIFLPPPFDPGRTTLQLMGVPGPSR